MKNLDSIAADLFQKIRGRFSTVTIGDTDGNVTNVPEAARFFDFAFTVKGEELGKVSVSLDEKNGVVVIVGKDLVQNRDQVIQNAWFNFLKELRVFAKKRLLPFDVRDINKSNLNKRDYKFLAANRPGENPMAESRMYGTHKTSYQRIGNARLAVKHTQPINVESVGGRSQKIGAIYIESPEGERFKYPFRHLAGARAMARHVSEGGNAYDDFGKYIAGLSEEAVKLQKFKSYMNRSSVMAETLAGYMDTVNERIQAVKKEIHNLQKEAFYKEAVANFTAPIVEEVPEDVAENWIDQLTIKQFNEELKDVFPYIYKLVGEATRAVELGPEDLVAEDSNPCWKNYKMVGMKKKGGREVPNCVPKESEEVEESGLQYYTGKKKYGKEGMAALAKAGREGASEEELGRIKDKYKKEEMDVEEAEKKGLYYYVNKRKKAGTSRPKNHPKAPSAQDWKDAAKTAKNESSFTEGLRPGRDFDLASKEYKGYVLGGIDDSDDDRYATMWGIYKNLGDGTYKEVSSVKDPKYNGKYTVSSFTRMPPTEEFKWTVDNYLAKAPEEIELEAGFDRMMGQFSEAGDHNFTADDLQQLQKLGNVDEIKRKAVELITTKSNKPMKPEKVAWFKRQIASKRSPMDVIKLMYDLMLSGDGQAVIGSRGSMSKNSYRDRFGEDDVDASEYSPPTDATMSPLSDTPEKPQLPLGEFILSYFDRETGKFPKGETAVLTAVQKDYGDQFVKPAAKFMKKVEATIMAKKAEQLQNSPYPQMEIMKQLAGL